LIAAVLMLATSAVAPPTCLRIPDAVAAPADPARAPAPAPAAVRHAFQNGHDVPLRLWWIDPRGAPVDLGTIDPGGFRSLQTYVGHLFAFTDAQGRCRRTARVDGVMGGTWVGTSRYRPVALREGWHVLLDLALDGPGDGSAGEPASAALATLAERLAEIEAVLPPRALAQVRATPIFLHRRAGYRSSFHPDPGWLVAHGRTVELVEAVELPDAEVFVDTVRSQPGIVLHELAHAYHARMSAADRAEVEATYRRAVAAGRYRGVQRNDGTAGDAYARTDAAEYFAELSEAFFGRNDYFPFTRAELASYDPDGERLLARLWR